MKKYFGEFNENNPIHPLIYDGEENEGFRLDDELVEEIKKLNIICAAYEHGSYDGSAFVLYEKDGKLFEVNDSHCSCHGLDAWEPEETTKEALLKRSDNYGVWAEFGKELKEIIRNL